MTEPTADSRPLTSTLVAASASGLFGAVLVRLAGFVRQMLTARTFGLTTELDAFILALLVPTLVGGVLGVAVNTVLIPKLIESQEAGKASPVRGVWSALLVVSIAGVCIGVLIMLLAEPIATLVDPAGLGARHDLIAGAVIVLAPLPLFIVQYETLAAGLVARSKYALATLLPIFTPAAISVAILAGARTAQGLAAAATIGGLAVVVSGLVLNLVFNGRPREAPGSLLAWVRILSLDATVVGLAIAIDQFTDFIDRAMAGALSEGSVSALEFGSRVPEAVLGVITVAVANVVARSSAQRASERDVESLLDLVRWFSKLVAGVGAVIALILVVLSQPIVNFVFLGDAFDILDAHRVGSIQTAFLFQIPFYLVTIVTGRALASVGRPLLIAASTAFHLVVSVSGNLLLMPVWGVVGIAAATSISYFLTSTVMYVVTNRAIKATTR